MFGVRFSNFFALIFCALCLGNCGPDESRPDSQSILAADKEPILAIKGDYKLYHRVFSFTHTFDLYKGDGDKVEATVAQHMFSWGRSFTVTDRQKNKLGEAKQKALSWGVQVEVFDDAGNKVGAFKEKVWESLFKYSTEYSIEDAKGNVIGTSKKLEWLATEVKIQDEKGRTIMTMNRPAFRLRDYWDISIYDQGVDPIIVVLIGAYKSATDADRAAKD